MMAVAQLTDGEAQREHQTLAEAFRSTDRRFIWPVLQTAQKV